MIEHKKRLVNLADQLATQVECAKKAGIYDQMFLGFGSLLGYCREGGFISNDDVMDVCFHSESITHEQERKFIEALKETGCDRYRFHVQFNPHTARLFWISIRKHPNHHGFKCCHWFWFTYKGYTWHHKGGTTLIKGTPSKYLELGPYVDFLGSKIRIPKYSGRCLDFWYPGWMMPRGDQSCGTILMTVDAWESKETWHIKMPGQYRC